MKKLLLLMVALSLVAFMVTLASASPADTVNGWVSDSQCGVKGAAAGQEACTKKCIEKGITVVVFDRGGYRYHGRIKALADAARKQFKAAGVAGF